MASSLGAPDEIDSDSDNDSITVNDQDDEPAIGFWGKKKAFRG